MKNEVLTLVRELQILREENFKIKRDNLLFQEDKKLKRLMKTSIGFFGYLSNSQSKFVSGRAKEIIEQYNKVMVSCDKPPFIPYIPKDAEAEKQ